MSTPTTAAKADTVTAPPAASEKDKAPEVSEEPTTPRDESPDLDEDANDAPVLPGVEANQNAQDTAREDVFTEYDTLTDLKAAQGPLQPTAVGGDGIERIVGPTVDDNWRPAPVHPEPAAIEHHEKVLAHQKARREERLGA